MFQEFLDEGIDTSLQPDVNPRYTIRDNNGEVISDDVQIDMKTPVTQNPTPLNRAFMSNLQGDLYTQDRYNETSVSYTTDTEIETSYYDNIFPTSWTKENDTSYYSGNILLTASSVRDSYYTPPDAFKDKSEDAWWISTRSSTSKWIKVFFPTPQKIIRMGGEWGTGSSGISCRTLIQGSKNNSTWVDLYSEASTTGTYKEVNLTNTDFYSYYRIYADTFSEASDFRVGSWNVLEYTKKEVYIHSISLPLTSYEKGKIINIQIGKYGDTTSFASPYLDINNLGEKKINKPLVFGEKCTLVYNGVSWDIVNPNFVAGSFIPVGSLQNVIVGFAPKLVIVYSNNSSISRILTRAYSSEDGVLSDTGFSFEGADTGNPVYYIAIG